jgi:hypothetical protein
MFERAAGGEAASGLGKVLWQRMKIEEVLMEWDCSVVLNRPRWVETDWAGLINMPRQYSLLAEMLCLPRTDSPTWMHIFDY